MFHSRRPFRFQLPLTLAFVCLAVVTSLRAQSIDDYVNQQMARQHIPGMSVAVIKGGKTVIA